MRFILLLVIFILSGCTKLLWNPDYGRDHLVGFFVNNHDNKLLVLGKSYAYTFDIDTSLKKALLLSRDVGFRPSLQGFKLSSDNIISGNLELHIGDGNLSDDILSELLPIGFVPSKHRGYFKEVSLKGIRHSVELNQEILLLEKSIMVSYQLPRGALDTASKIILTPVTIAGDVTLGVAGLIGWTAIRVATALNKL